jgi:hypothetical protein
MEKEKCGERKVCTATVRVSIPEHCPRGNPNWMCAKENGGKCDEECLAEMKESYEKSKGELSCCLYAPHDHLKHLNPRILLDCGGDHLDIPGWSYYEEEVGHNG